MKKYIFFMVLLQLSFCGAVSALPSGAPASKSEAKKTPLVKADSATATEKDNDQENVRDPFAEGNQKPVADTLTPQPGENQNEVVLTLEGLALGQGTNQAAAIINGDTYRQGEPKSGMEVIEVRKKEVDVSLNGVVRTLRLIPEIQTRKKEESTAVAAADKNAPESPAKEPVESTAQDKLESSEKKMGDKDLPSKIIQESAEAALQGSANSSSKEDS